MSFEATQIDVSIEKLVNFTNDAFLDSLDLFILPI
jgi:hypothetical protein